ncbi:MAG TPA: hypothetical protein VNB94_11075 [Mycobacteriales bacterium]|nr:hypothetical protein [Mycobacteriales bacterium]
MTSAESGRRGLISRSPASGLGRRGPSGPLYPKLLRLKHLHLSAWQRAALVEGSIAVGAVAALADQVTAWTPVVLPIAVAAVVKFHDVLTGVLSPSSASRARPPSTPGDEVAAYLGRQSALPPLAGPRLTGRTPVAEPDPVAAPAPVAPPAPVTASLERPTPARPVVTAAQVRADLDLLTSAAVERALRELAARGGLDTFVMTLTDAATVDLLPLRYPSPGSDADAAIARTLTTLAGDDRAGLRAVAVARDVAIPGRQPRDAVRIDIEHAHGEPERVTAIYRRVGVSGQVVVGEQTRRAGRRSGVARRVFGADPGK